MKELSPKRRSKKILLGTLMGDSSLFETSHKKAMFKTTHGADQIHYLMYKLNALYPLLGSFRVSFTGGGSFERWNAKKRITAWSLSSTYLKHIYDDFYSNKIKKVRLNVLRRMDESSLAFWYMDDGCLAKSNGKFYGIHLNTQGFDLEDQETIIKYFSETWKIKFHITEERKNNKTYYYLRANKEDSERFLNLINPFICSSMLYKVDPSYERMEHSDRDEDIVRTLQECKEIIRNDNPSEDSKIELNGEILEDISKKIETKGYFVKVNHWRQKTPIIFFRVSGDYDSLEKIKMVFGGCIYFSRVWIYQATINSFKEKIFPKISPFLKTNKFKNLPM